MNSQGNFVRLKNWEKHRATTLEEQFPKLTEQIANKVWSELNVGEI